MSQRQGEGLELLAAARKSRLFLIGYRGSGKSAVARELAERLQWSWLDADAVLEQRHGRTIRQIFADDGEAAFRDLETGILAEMCSLERHVIATGGGVILRAENRERLRAAGTVIWLKADPATLWQRMQGDAATADRRPNLSVGGLAEVVELLALREPLYAEAAHFVMETGNRSVSDVATSICKVLGFA